MKYVFAVMMIAGANSSAQACKSALVYQVYNSCSSLESGLRWPEAKVVVPAGAPQISTTQGGHNLADECEKMRKLYDRNDEQNKMAYRGHIVSKQELPQVEHRSNIGNILLSVDYNYSCTIETQQIPYGAGPAKSCGGVASQWLKADAAKDPASIGGQVKCLSCDDIDDAQRALACISASVSEVIEPKAVALDAKDISAVQATVNELIQYQRVYKSFTRSEATALANISEKVNALSAQ